MHTVHHSTYAHSTPFTYAHSILFTVTSKIIATRNELDKVYGKMLGMAERAGMDSLDVPRICGRQTQWNNFPARSLKEYF